MDMSPSSFFVDGGQHDAKYVTFELLLHAAFVVDEIRGFMLEPARILSNTALRLFPLFMEHRFQILSMTSSYLSRPKSPSVITDKRPTLRRTAGHSSLHLLGMHRLPLGSVRGADSSFALPRFLPRSLHEFLEKLSL